MTDINRSPPFRFQLFGGITYYAKGGAHDFLGAFNEQVEAEAEAAILYNDEHYDVEWWHVYDTHTGRVVAGSESQALGAPDLEDIL